MSKSDLAKFASKANIVDQLHDEVLGQIASRISQDYQRDLQSMSEWLRNVNEAVKIASLTKEPKNSPFQGAASIKYPLITDACSAFSSKIYPEIVQDGKVVKVGVLGTDFSNTKVDRANRVADFMNWQLLFQTTEWEEGLDKLLSLLPLIGCVFKKTYYDADTTYNCSQVCDYKDIVIDATVPTFKALRRITHVLRNVSLNSMVSMSRLGVYSEKAVHSIIEKCPDTDTMNPMDLLEHHCYLDLDGDHFEEPYIVTMEKETNNILRIKPRYTEKDIKENKKGVYFIDEEQYFTDYHFLPNPTGSFLSVGFGTLMLHLNMSINTILNQLIDSGTLATMQGGYIDSRIKLPTGSSRHNPGEWIRATPIMGQELQSGFVPLNYKEPSNVLLQLLGTLIQAGQKLSGSSDVQTGQVLPDNAKTGATNSILERGLEGVNAIQRRFYRSEKNELYKLFVLNSKYADEKVYFKVLDDNKAVFKDDFNLEDLDISPVADPNLSSDAQRLKQIQILQSLKADPGVDIREINMRTLSYSRIQEPEKILPEPKGPPPPNPEVIKLQADMAHEQEKNRQGDVALKQKQQELDMQQAKLEAEIEKIKSESMRNIGQAESFQVMHSFKDLELSLSMLSTKMDAVQGLQQMQHEKDMQAQQQQHEQTQQASQLEADQNAANQQGSSPDVGGTPSDSAPA